MLPSVVTIRCNGDPSADVPHTFFFHAAKYSVSFLCKADARCNATLRVAVAPAPSPCAADACPNTGCDNVLMVPELTSGAVNRAPGDLLERLWPLAWWLKREQERQHDLDERQEGRPEA